jgi:hypothetical protein
MTCSNDARSKRLLSATAATGLAFSALFMLGAIVPAAHAGNHHDRHGGDRHGDDRGHYGGYYAAPPVVYGSPYYAPPPVVYGSGIGIELPGVAIGIR